MLQKFREYRLTVKAEQFIFGCEEITYLGHKVSGSGIETKEVVGSIVKSATPKNKEEQKSFLGINYIVNLRKGLQAGTFR